MYWIHTPSCNHCYTVSSLMAISQQSSIQLGRVVIVTSNIYQLWCVCMIIATNGAIEYLMILILFCDMFLRAAFVFWQCFDCFFVYDSCLSRKFARLSYVYVNFVIQMSLFFFCVFVWLFICLSSEVLHVVWVSTSTLLLLL